MEVHEMSAEECKAVLEHASLGRLGCSCENQPYVVPIHFAYDSRYLYVFTTFGQKVKWMRANPKVCVKRIRHRIRASGSVSLSTVNMRNYPSRNIQPSVSMRVHCSQNAVIGGLMHWVSGK